MDRVGGGRGRRQKTVLEQQYIKKKMNRTLLSATAWVTCTNVTLGERNLTRMSNSFSPGATSASGLPSKGQM